MSNDAKIAKFKIFFEEICTSANGWILLKDTVEEEYDEEEYDEEEYGEEEYDEEIEEGDDFLYSIWIGLALIYDCNKLNDYGKIIMDFADRIIQDEKREDFLSHGDMEYKVKTAKKFADHLNAFVSFSIFERNADYDYILARGKEMLKGVIYRFIFWALMILAVDDTDKEEHLASICDLVKLWKIDDEEILDIVRIIRIVYYREEDVKLQTTSVKANFEQILKHYGYDDKC
ncbi:MAG: hypothetical protein NC433_18025 [Clostridiales bacterium]|nr:hypothetical protein [Clostridiales bacterium]